MERRKSIRRKWMVPPKNATVRTHTHNLRLCRARLRLYDEQDKEGKKKLYFHSPRSYISRASLVEKPFPVVLHLTHEGSRVVLQCTGVDTPLQIIEKAVSNKADHDKYILRVGNKEGRQLQLADNVEYLSEPTVPLQSYAYVLHCLENSKDVELWLDNKEDVGIQIGTRQDELLSDDVTVRVVVHLLLMSTHSLKKRMTPLLNMWKQGKSQKACVSECCM